MLQTIVAWKRKKYAGKWGVRGGRWKMKELSNVAAARVPVV